AEYRSLAIDPAASGACAFGKCLRQIGGLYVAIVGMADGAYQAILHRQRPYLEHLLRRQEFDPHSDGSRDACVLAVLVQAVAVGCEANVADLPKAHILPGLLLQRLVE